MSERTRSILSLYRVIAQTQQLRPQEADWICRFGRLIQPDFCKCISASTWNSLLYLIQASKTTIQGLLCIQRACLSSIPAWKLLGVRRFLGFCLCESCLRLVRKREFFRCVSLMMVLHGNGACGNIPEVWRVVEKSSFYCFNLNLQRCVYFKKLTSKVVVRETI